MPRTALIAVDVQPDFMPGGALPVQDGDAVVGALVGAIDAGRALGSVDLVVATGDQHPPDHLSFADRGGPWPVHCVKGTPGAEVHPAIAARADLVLEKATDPERESYSAFDGTGLADVLRERGVERVLLGGLATDVCVDATARDALREGFAVVLLEAASRGLDGTAAALDALAAEGVEVVRSP